MNKALPSTAKPFIIPIFIPHAGCPHRCIFCNQTIISGEKQLLPDRESFRKQVRDFIAHKGKNRKIVEIAFYGGNFLGLEEETVHMFLTEAAAFVRDGQVDGVRFSTRPDTVDFNRLGWLKDYPIAAIELGIQSMNDEVLRLSNRGHRVQDSQEAVKLLKEKNYRTGLQLMVGLPGDTEERAVDSARQAAALSPDFMRLYPTVVLKDSPLAGFFKLGKYQPLSLQEAVTITKKMFLVFDSCSIPVIRMGLQAAQELDSGTSIVAGPYHPAFGQLVYAGLFLDKARALLQKDKTGSKSITFRVHPRSRSRLQGLYNQNLQILQKEFGLNAISIRIEDSLSENELRADF